MLFKKIYRLCSKFTNFYVLISLFLRFFVNITGKKIWDFCISLGRTVLLIIILNYYLITKLKYHLINVLNTLHIAYNYLLINNRLRERYRLVLETNGVVGHMSDNTNPYYVFAFAINHLGDSSLNQKCPISIMAELHILLVKAVCLLWSLLLT